MASEKITLRFENVDDNDIIQSEVFTIWRTFSTLDELLQRYRNEIDKDINTDDEFDPEGIIAYVKNTGYIKENSSSEGGEVEPLSIANNDLPVQGGYYRYSDGKWQQIMLGSHSHFNKDFLDKLGKITSKILEDGTSEKTAFLGVTVNKDGEVDVIYDDLSTLATGLPELPFSSEYYDGTEGKRKPFFLLNDPDGKGLHWSQDSIELLTNDLSIPELPKDTSEMHVLVFDPSTEQFYWESEKLIQPTSKTIVLDEIVGIDTDYVVFNLENYDINNIDESSILVMVDGMFLYNAEKILNGNELSIKYSDRTDTFNAGETVTVIIFNDNKKEFVNILEETLKRNYVSKSEVENMLKVRSENYIRKYVKDHIGEYFDEHYAPQEHLHDQYAPYQHIHSDYVTDEEVTNKIYQILDEGGNLNVDRLREFITWLDDTANNSVNLNNILSRYAIAADVFTKDEIAEYYYSKTETYSKSEIDVKLGELDDAFLKESNFKTINGQTIIRTSPDDETNIEIIGGGTGSGNIISGEGDGSVQQIIDGEPDLIFKDLNQNASTHGKIPDILKKGAKGDFSVSLNGETVADGARSFAQGDRTVTTGFASHAEGQRSVAIGDAAHAEGIETLALGDGSHAEGLGTIAIGKNQTVIGVYNTESEDDLFIIGNGTETKRSNAVEVKNNGDVNILNNLNVSGVLNSESFKKLELEDNNIIINTEVKDSEETSGIIVKKSKDDGDSYGIVYDPKIERVRIGNGNLDSSGKFTYGEDNENDVIASIDSGVSNNNLVRWDEEKKTLVDSGVTLREYSIYDEEYEPITWNEGEYSDDLYYLNIYALFGSINQNIASYKKVSDKTICPLDDYLFNSIFFNSVNKTEEKITENTSILERDSENIVFSNEYRDVTLNIGLASTIVNIPISKFIIVNSNNWNFESSIDIGINITTVLKMSGLTPGIYILTDKNNEHALIPSGSLFKETKKIDQLDEKFIPGKFKNITSGEGTGSLQQIQDQETNVSEGYFNFTNKNPNATNLDSNLTGEIKYGAKGDFSNAFGGKSAAIGKRSHAEGTTTIAKGKYSHAEGDNSVTLADDSHAEGFSTVTNGKAAHAEGSKTQALGEASHAEGALSIASGNYSHSEGHETRAEKEASHAEGIGTVASGKASHAEGIGTLALGDNSHVGGKNSTSNYESSFVHGEGLRDTLENQVVFGKFNSEKWDHPRPLFVIGNGESEESRSNAFEIETNGDAKIFGSLEVSGNLTVTGTTTSIETVTLEVEDNLIVANAKNADLLEGSYSGLAIKTGDENNVAGITYDPSDHTVKFGYGTIQNNEFKYNDDEGLPLAVRDDDSQFYNGNIISWDSSKNKLTDSGINKENVVTTGEVFAANVNAFDFTDIITAYFNNNEVIADGGSADFTVLFLDKTELA